MKARRSSPPLGLVICLYAVFVVYGSLVPLDFHPISLDEALQRFRAIRYLELGISSRADWVANLLLFVPLGFMACGFLSRPGRLVRNIGTSFFVFAACIAQCVAIEFAQLYFPARTVSINDIVAESLGGAIGIAAWWLCGARVSAFWSERWSRGIFSTNPALYVYLFVFFGYSVLPLDLTLSPVELYHKWQMGRIVLRPFGFAFDNPSQALYVLSTDILLWGIPGLLAILGTRRSARSVWLRLVLAACALEFVQLWVYSRISDVTDVFTAAMGAAVGIFVGGRIAQRRERSRAQIAPRWLLAAMAWLGLLVIVFWYPFALEPDPSVIRSRLHDFMRTPFSTYYFTSEYSAITQLLRRFGFFFPLGAMLALPLVGARPERRRLRAGAALLGIAAIALSLELGQVFLVDKTADLTDWLLETAGGAAGLWAAVWVAGRSDERLVRRSPRVAAESLVPQDPVPHAVGGSASRAAIVGNPGLLLLVGGWIGLGLLGLLVGRSPLVPYNVRELLGDRHPGLDALMFSSFLYWGFGAPVWISGRLRRSRNGRWWFPAAVLLHAAVGWLLLRAAAPLESIHDIVGTPVLGWSDAGEMFVRFVALFSVVSSTFLLAALVARGAATGRWRRILVYGALWSILLGLLSYGVAVAGAATDNLTELMAGGGTLWSATCLAAFWCLIALSASFLAACPLAEYRRIRGAAAIVAILSLPLAYLSVSMGTASAVEKYGQTFSALQFLLSPDRDHLASGLSLTVRYLVLHAALVLGIGFIQFPLWSLQAHRDRRGGSRRHAPSMPKPK